MSSPARSDGPGGRKTSLPSRQRVVPIERFAGVAPQFLRTDGGYYFRRDLRGPAIRVTVAERNAFARAGLWSVGIHAVALAVLLWMARIFVKRTFASHGEIIVAIAFGVAGSLVTMALYASMRWHADAPGRALAGRPAERPALDHAPKADVFHTYGMILGSTLILLFMAATGTKGSTSFYVTFATAALMLALFLVVRKWLFEWNLMPEQRLRARAWMLVKKPGAPTEEPVNPLAVWRMILLFIFFLLEFVAMGGGVVAGLVLAEIVSGQPAHDLTFVAGAIGIVAGFVFAAIGVLSLEWLCIRLTYQSAFSIIRALPADW